MRILLITGLFRSGTTLLGNLLALHPTVRMAWQPYGPFFRTVRNLFGTMHDARFDTAQPMGIEWRNTSFLRERFLHIMEDVTFDKASIATLRHDLDAYLKQDDANTVNARLKPSGIAERLDELRPGSAFEVLLQLLALLEPNQGIQGITTCAFKEVFVEEFVEPLQHRLGEEFGCVHIIRDPRAVAFSRNNGLFRQQAGTAYPLAFIAESWNRSAALASVHASMNRVAVARYEDIVHDPLVTLPRVASRLGLDAPGVIQALQDGLPTLNATNSSFETSCQGVSVSSVARWMEAPSEAFYLENACSEGMRAFGYTPMAHKGEPQPPKEDRTQYPPWLQPYYDPRVSRS